MSGRRSLAGVAFLTDAEYDARDLGYRRNIRRLRMEIIWHELTCMADDGAPDDAAFDALLAEYEAWQRHRCPP